MTGPVPAAQLDDVDLIAVSIAGESWADVYAATLASRAKADISGVMIAGGIASLPVGGSAALMLYALGQVDPVTLAIAAGAPIALSALARGLKNTHTEHHHHTGTVFQDHSNVINHSRGLITRTHNHLRR
ncbi:hypothetical protein [Streptomyces sp. NPDC053048]|uniref:hypothetical protein n=1 Tax=Streptomyces sp. NPDC053048 TaxID=3365694 RepID=UPI0037D6DAFB